MNVNKIDPPFWYAGMKNPELQLMIYGEGIGNASVSVNYPGISLSSTVKLESNNYLLVYLHLDKDVKPGKFPLTFTIGKKKLVKEYELKARNKKGCEHKGFDVSDALYLLMPDRFANGNPENDNIDGMSPYKVDRNDPNAVMEVTWQVLSKIWIISRIWVLRLSGHSGFGKQHGRWFLSRLCHYGLLQSRSPIRYERRISPIDSQISRPGHQDRNGYDF